MEYYTYSSIASSAPIRREAPCNGWYRVITNNYNATASGQKCVETIRKSWAAIDRVAIQGEHDEYFLKSASNPRLISYIDGGMEWLESKLYKCPSMLPVKDVTELKEYVKAEFWLLSTLFGRTRKQYEVG